MRYLFMPNNENSKKKKKKEGTQEDELKPTCFKHLAWLAQTVITGRSRLHAYFHMFYQRVDIMWSEAFLLSFCCFKWSCSEAVMRVHSSVGGSLPCDTWPDRPFKIRPVDIPVHRVTFVAVLFQLLQRGIFIYFIRNEVLLGSMSGLIELPDRFSTGWRVPVSVAWC